ncbi:MAG: hypothetical protein ACI9XO_004213 [Paraglaciecola sp.]|jgi:hypothetical protein
MKKIALFIPILFLSVVSIAQKQDFQWLFGYNSQSSLTGGCVLDFNYEPPITYEQDRELNFDVTVGSVCNKEGDLLFYTNGINIHNHAHQLIKNGDSLNPGNYANDWFYQGYFIYQSLVALTSSLQNNSHSLFHLKLSYNNNFGITRTELLLTQINMLSNGGIGTVISKNESILEDKTIGTITAVRHGNGRD